MPNYLICRQWAIDKAETKDTKTQRHKNLEIHNRNET